MSLKNLKRQEFSNSYILEDIQIFCTLYNFNWLIYINITTWYYLKNEIFLETLSIFSLKNKRNTKNIYLQKKTITIKIYDKTKKKIIFEKYNNRSQIVTY